MSINIGYITRTNAKVPLRVVRGYNPESSLGTHRAAPVKSGETIYSGMLITLEWVSGNSRYEWVKGVPASWGNSATNVPLIYWALTDGSKEDVIASDGLIGLPCSGNYVLQTPYFTGTAADFDNDRFVTYDGTTGSIKIITGLETAAEPIIGQVMASSLAGVSDVSPYDISAGLGTQNVVTLRTMFLPNLADA